MLKLFIALFGLILVYWIYKKKKQLFVRHPQVEPVITTLEAYELQAFLDATTPLAVSYTHLTLPTTVSV